MANTNPLVTAAKQEQVYNFVNLSSGSALNLGQGNYFYKTITGTTTFTVTNVPSNVAVGFLLELTNPGSQTLNWPASFKWPGGAAPSWTVSGVDVIVGVTRDGGVTWRVARVMRDSK